MNLHSMLCQREEQGKPIRVGLIGAGKFGSMYLAQVPKIPGVRLLGIADLSPPNVIQNLERIGLSKDAFAAKSLDDADAQGSTHVTEDWTSLVSHPSIDIIIEATGNPMAGVEHALASIENGKDLIMVVLCLD